MSFKQITTDDLERICEIEKDFDVLEVINDSRFGQVTLMKCIKEDNIIIMRKER